MINSFYQKALFTRWLADNRHLFSHEPYIDVERDNYFTVRFKGITRHIACQFVKDGAIMMQVYYRNQYFDIVSEFDLSEEKTSEGRYLCRLCRDHPSEVNPPTVLEYATRDELWIKHSFEPLAEYTRATFTKDAMLCLCRDQGSSSGLIGEGELLTLIKSRRDFFKAIPVVEQRRAKRK